MINIKKKYLIQLQFIFLICTFIISINSFISAKYITKNEICIANINIDRTKPYIEIVGINNTNTGYEGYANKTHEITINVKIIEKNIKNINFDKEHVIAEVENNCISYEKITFEKVKDIVDGQIYQIKLNNIDGNGKLKLKILEETVIDQGGLKNDIKTFDTNILIDNIAPDGKFLEKKITDGKVNGIVNINEKIRNIDGWKISEDELKLEKEFTNNISYELPVIDYAGNKSNVKIIITQATYIKITYASHNSVIGWSFGYGNYDVAGKNAVEINPKYKTEALAFNISGNVEPDFVQAKAYIYTHWGKDTSAICSTSGITYNYGYNPNDSTYKSMISKDLVTIDGKKYFQLGGGGVNAYPTTDINGRNPIPLEIASQYRYGICGINFRLKDYSQFSVVYQCFIDKVGWIKSCADGEECMYNKVSPISAFRIALIPKSEKQRVLDTWNKDIGTSNMK